MTGWPEKKLGFGLMRLPKEDGVIDRQKVCQLADAFLAAGFTYFDTAYVYEGSEEAFRECVVRRHPRASFTIADKMAVWKMTDAFGPEEMFAESLARCGVDYFDFYLMHSMNGGPTRGAGYEKRGCWAFARRMKEEGKIRKLGFSYHGDPDYLRTLLTDHPEVDFVQLQINYVDWYSDAIYSGANYAVCREFGKDITVMEPVKGGQLASLPPAAMDQFTALRPDAKAASWALRFAGSLPGVRVVLSGMNELSQMAENTATFTGFEPLSDEEQAAVAAVRDILLSVPTVPCTACRYCTEGCPMAINIPEIFKAYNMYLSFGDHNRPGLYYDTVKDLGSGRAGDCIGCGQCESVCPQQIPIIEHLRKASAYLDR